MRAAAFFHDQSGHPRPSSSLLLSHQSHHLLRNSKSTSSPCRKRYASPSCSDECPTLLSLSERRSRVTLSERAGKSQAKASEWLRTPHYPVAARLRIQAGHLRRKLPPAESRSVARSRRQPAFQAKNPLSAFCRPAPTSLAAWPLHQSRDRPYMYCRDPRERPHSTWATQSSTMYSHQNHAQP